jgi:hypothetical protein
MEVNNNSDILVAYALGLDMAALKLKQNPQTKLKTMENVPQTGLVVLLIDPDTGILIWAGVATAELRSCFKITQVSARQGKNLRESAVYME